MAIALLGILVAAALELLAVGLRSAKASGDYTQGVLLGKRKLDELSLRQPVPGTLEGTLDAGYRWIAEIVPEGQETQELPAKLFTLRIKVFWTGRSGDKAVELVTLRTATEEERAGTPQSVTR